MSIGDFMGTSLRGMEKPRLTQACAIPKPADTAGFANTTPSLAKLSVVRSVLLPCEAVSFDSIVSEESLVMVMERHDDELMRRTMLYDTVACAFGGSFNRG
jgi:hypothetical protein